MIPTVFEFNVKPIKFYSTYSPQETQQIQKYTKPPCLHLFSGESNIGNIRVDKNNEKANHRMSVFRFLEMNFLWFESVICNCFGLFDDLPNPDDIETDDVERRLLEKQLAYFSWADIYAQTGTITQKERWKFNLYMERNRFLLNEILRISPQYILIKGWTVPIELEKRGYSRLTSMVGHSEYMLPSTNLSIFQRLAATTPMISPKIDNEELLGHDL